MYYKHKLSFIPRIGRLRLKKFEYLGRYFFSSQLLEGQYFKKCIEGKLLDL